MQLCISVHTCQTVRLLDEEKINSFGLKNSNYDLN